MVKVYDENGKHVFSEPPYTEDEEDEFYRRIGGGPVAILHGPKMTQMETTMWTTRMHWKGEHNWVVLMRDGDVVAELTLDDWAKLGATEFLVTDALEAAAEAARQEALGNTEPLDPE
ncbi:hypothetical protein ABID65_006699 [Bradyrhizobium sp. S3.9.2]|uniref:hypothetical protein n=1 Tax=Bradyrhizobium sp. S3.9.2 TaxID=3156432 RepID=UPI003392FF1E